MRTRTVNITPGERPNPRTWALSAGLTALTADVRNSEVSRLGGRPWGR